MLRVGAFCLPFSLWLCPSRTVIWSWLQISPWRIFTVLRLMDWLHAHLHWSHLLPDIIFTVGVWSFHRHISHHSSLSLSLSISRFEKRIPLIFWNIPSILILFHPPIWFFDSASKDCDLSLFSSSRNKHSIRLWLCKTLWSPKKSYVLEVRIMFQLKVPDDK